MRRPIIILLLLLLAYPAFSTIALVQATTSDNTGNPVTRQFGTTTISGDMLLCTVAATVHDSSPVSPPVISTPSTPGFSWLLAASESFLYDTYNASIVSVYYIPNAASMGTTVTTSVSATGAGGLGMQLLEVSGVGAIDDSAGAGGTAPTPASTRNLNVTAPADFILGFVTDPNFDTEFTAGPGYTLISTGGTGSQYGDNQYQVTSGSGSYATGFGSGISGSWVMVAIAFKPAVLVVPRHRGFVN